MTILIRNIKESSDVFDVNSRDRVFFHFVDRTKVRMTKEEQAEFLASNYVVGYAGKEFALSSWCHKASKGLHNINVDMNAADLRQYLWHLVNFEFSADRNLRVAEGYYILQKLSSIAEKSKNHDITLWTLSAYDRENAKLLKRFLTYLANK
ncbi:hypothetical protein [Microcoleus sp. bin38.metabat.b11b12b14.051]|uniref:hypothetical protein n=1 Tax=Microcoleus sp. bin38.metabat.b11b12b14.051 TaxID=2742709 RepID=UPI0025FE5BC4|nr:hypothetical protein [Microcoleus sp. bin38.metabat.b11b12b14.051]